MSTRHPLSRVVVASVLSLSVTGGVSGCTASPVADPPTGAAPASPVNPDQFYAVLLTTGTVYYGKLEGYGTPYPTLREVFYAQRRVNEKENTVSSVFIKRGAELHAPDRMILNPAAIVLIEPVTKDSQLAELIAKASTDPSPSPDARHEPRP